MDEESMKWGRRVAAELYHSEQVYSVHVTRTGRRGYDVCEVVLIDTADYGVCIVISDPKSIGDSSSRELTRCEALDLVVALAEMLNLPNEEEKDDVVPEPLLYDVKALASVRAADTLRQLAACGLSPIHAAEIARCGLELAIDEVAEKPYKMGKNGDNEL